MLGVFQVLHDLNAAVLVGMTGAHVQGAAVVPENLGGLVQAEVGDALASVGPAGCAAVAEAAVLVVPPELEATEGAELIPLDAEDMLGIQQLLMCVLSLTSIGLIAPAPGRKTLFASTPEEQNESKQNHVAV